MDINTKQYASAREMALAHMREDIVGHTTRDRSGYLEYWTVTPSRVYTKDTRNLNSVLSLSSF